MLRAILPQEIAMKGIGVISKKTPAAEHFHAA
jgi:hypothetical protein